ncbi:MAG: hypothetical protein R3324_18735, partial [Halobacteriales archaeon]|nr:hypothetical protein [Halobacteriales archaeon]
GQPHTFKATVYEVDGTEPDTLADGVTVSFDWDPGTAEGSTLLPMSCVTGADDAPTGTCEVVASDGGEPGTGTISITRLEGTVGDGDSLDVPFVVGAEGTPSTTKTWREYRATIDGNSVNPSGEDHTFYVTIEYRDDEDLDWEHAPAGITVSDYTWGDDGVVKAADSTCLNGGTDDDPRTENIEETNVCTFVVTSPAPGSGTLEVTEVEGTLLGDFGTSSETYAVLDTATKTWLDFEVDIFPDGDNLIGDLHVFTIYVEQYDGTNYVPIADDSTITFNLSDDDASYVSDTCTYDASTQTGGTSGGACTVTVNRATPGAVTLTATGITGYGEFDEPTDVVFGDGNDTDEVDPVLLERGAVLVPRLRGLVGEAVV